MTDLALASDETLLILKGAFLVLLYLFILLIARSATKDLGGAPQESIILGAAEAAELRAQLPVRPAAFRVLEGPGLRTGSTLTIGSATVVGRDAGSGIRLDGDDFASSRHASIEPGADGVWVEDLGSTNGTFVNGERITARTLVRAGDAVRIGQTELVLER
ncbi:MAG TPA: FHA domain-containing protein [Gaiellaceae bacterium]|nr:FHA domain-containing protein [Gaiellaceae bacterium]